MATTTAVLQYDSITARTIFVIMSLGMQVDVKTCQVVLLENMKSNSSSQLPINIARQGPPPLINIDCYIHDISAHLLLYVAPVTPHFMKKGYRLIRRKYLDTCLPLGSTALVAVLIQAQYTGLWIME